METMASSGKSTGPTGLGVLGLKLHWKYIRNAAIRCTDDGADGLAGVAVYSWMNMQVSECVGA